MDNLDKNTTTNFSESKKQDFLFSANWMKTYSITLIIVLGLFFMLFGAAFLIGGSELEAEMNKSAARRSPQEAMLIKMIIPLVFDLMSIMFIVTGAYIFAAIILLRSGINFGRMSYSSEAEHTIKGFKNLKNYWMINGFLIIVKIFLFVWFMIKIIPIILDAQKLKGG